MTTEVKEKPKIRISAENKEGLLHVCNNIERAYETEMKELKISNITYNDAISALMDLARQYKLIKVDVQDKECVYYALKHHDTDNNIVAGDE